MASDEPRAPQLPALGDPPAGRSDVATMGTDGSRNEGEAMGAAGDPLGDVILIATPLGLFLNPKTLSSMKPGEEVSAHPLCPANMAAASQGKKQCVQCGATATPQWRIHPMGQGALCNSCRIWLRPAEALREPVRVPWPAAATPTTVISMREKSPSPAPAPATAAPEKKKKLETKRKPWHPPKSSKQCHRPAASPTAIDGSPEMHIVCGVGGELQMADPSSLDEFLFNGPAAPMLIDDEGLAD